MVLSLVTSTIAAEVKIVSTAEWNKKDFGTTWSCDQGLTHTSTVWGDCYYNPGWQDMSKSQNLESKAVWRYFHAKPNYERGWDFSFPITNLNAQKGYSYYAKSSPNKKQDASQIYWCVTIGLVTQGKKQSVSIWLKRSDRDIDPDYGFERYGSAEYITYCVSGGNWITSSTFYPSCEQSAAPKLRVTMWPGTSSDNGSTSIYWGNLCLTSFPFYTEEVEFVSISVGTQAKIQIGEPVASAYSTNCRYSNSESFIQEGRYERAKQELQAGSSRTGLYCEKQAYLLALVYLQLEEYDNCMEMCNALVQYKGEYISNSYYLRGLVTEVKGNYLQALDDYSKAGSIASEDYNRLNNAIFHSNANQSQPRQNQSPKQNKKPQLTR